MENQRFIFDPIFSIKYHLHIDYCPAVTKKFIINLEKNYPKNVERVFLTDYYMYFQRRAQIRHQFYGKRKVDVFFRRSIRHWRWQKLKK